MLLHTIQSTGRPLTALPKLVIASFFALACCTIVPAKAETVTVDNSQSLIEAMSAEVSRIELRGTIELDSAFTAGLALPKIEERSLEIFGADGSVLRATGQGFRLLELGAGSDLTLMNLQIQDFDSAGDGGAVLVQGGRLELNGVRFAGNRSSGDGGALAIAEFARLRIVDSEFEDNQAGGRGGAIQMRASGFVEQFARNRFSSNLAEEGCALALDMGSPSRHVAITDSLFQGECQQSLLDVDSDWMGPALYRNTWLFTDGKAINYKVPEQRGSIQLRLAANLMTRVDDQSTALCSSNDVPGALWPAFVSAGSNVASDDTCGLDSPSDRIVGGASDVLDVAALPQPAGQALGAVGPVQIDWSDFPGRCSIADLNGLGRPQGALDSDGFWCDAGAIERQRGADIGAAQTGAYFNPERAGEGYFLEILENGLAWVAYFGFEPIGGSPPIMTRQPHWLVGLGQVVGNSVVVPEIHSTSGGRFGAGFDPDSIRHSRSRGGLSMVFPTCESGHEEPGVAYFRSNQVGLEDVPIHNNVIVPVVRLGQIVDCENSQVSSRSGLSGSFYDPQRDGEGLIVQWLSEEQAVLAWYTYTPQGNRFWLVSDAVEVAGNRLIADMVYPAASTGFGGFFDPDEVELESWGQLIVEYSDCQEAKVWYASELSEYGSGSHVYRRLTQPAGTTCEM